MSLSAHLENRSGPVRQFLDAHFQSIERCCRYTNGEWGGGATFNPSIDPSMLYRGGRWRPGEPTILPIQSIAYPWATVGTAFDYRFRYFFSILDFGTLAAFDGVKKFLLTFAETKFDPVKVYRELDEWIGAFVGGADRVAGLSSKSEEEFARACWTLALFEQRYRSGPTPNSPLLTLGRSPTLEQVFELCSDPCAEDIANLAAALERSQGDLISRRPAFLNPRFVASTALGGADADLIVAQELLEVKVTIKGELSRQHLLQLLAYSLSDWDDEYELSQIGVYYARQGVAISWPLDKFVVEASGGKMNLVSARTEFRKLVKSIAAQRQSRGFNISINYRSDESPTRQGLATSHSNQSAGKILRHFPFRPPTSGHGKWHVSMADSGRSKYGAGKVKLRQLPACGSSTVLLTTSGDLLIPEVGELSDKYLDRLCGNCLRLTRFLDE